MKEVCIFLPPLSQLVARRSKEEKSGKFPPGCEDAVIILFLNMGFFVNQLLKKESPTNEEERLLLEVISSDSATIATTLKKLLHCGENIKIII